MNYNNKEISMITKEVSFEVKNTKKGSLYVENILGRDLRIAAIAIKQALPSDYHAITNDQLKKLAAEVGVSHITLLAKTSNDIIGVRSSEVNELNMSTKDWGYWYDAFKQIFALVPVSVGKGLTLPHYWSGPIEIASSNPKHVDKWGYYYDGTTNYMIDPFFRDDKVLEYQKRFGPEKIIQDFTKDPGVLELTVFNPKNFGKKKEFVHLNGNIYIKISDQPIWYGSYQFKSYKKDADYIKKSIQTKNIQSYKDHLKGNNIIKTFVPVFPSNDEPFVIGIVYNYGLIQQELNHELQVHILLSIAIMIVVLIVSFIFSRSITKPIAYIAQQVNEIAQGNFGKTLHITRKDELGFLAENVNALSRHLQSFVSDLTESKQLIEYQAFHDPLTGLLNRRYFQEKLSPIIEHANQTREPLSVLFIDMDRFKEINDSFGHNKGDQILKIIADRIKLCLPDEDRHIISRQGGDEFTILLVNVSKEEAIIAAEAVVASLKKPYILDGNEFYLGASCGISLYPDHTKNLDSLFIYADLAMYAAKKMGGNKVVFYSDQLLKTTIDKPLYEARLRKALENQTIAVFYQPKINVASGELLGAEALLRWTDEELGNVSPEIFIPIAEDTGLIHPLWEFVMTMACHQVSEWNQDRSHPLSVSVNFSARQFQEPHYMVKRVKEILDGTRLAPQNFEIEITESILLSNSSEIVDSLRYLRDLGISISIDDFGTGYSSLSYLRNLPIDTLKIDKSFIMDITEDYRNSEIPEAIINLARSLHLNVIAEGVEKNYQKEFLLSKNCVQMQGYLFSKPLNKDEFTRFQKMK
ncbi:GGDEF domain-containing phosphodiesterase [Neobacillus endophyticus]|uniref:GGDEF domain-containing phosphodiesterase n=1 Tax=Neobacillus endophyticus TaxID=2738405 RepID=UPI001FEA34B1|nr:GGDEF domain-containing phosphodiesterase [Neobacillus endophyticus]